ncbi:DUF1800 domain-containing protein [Pseudaestuariivita atlantica]|uniref:DUF1800 domain-containing protein n=1 Tax=Pseudaestuariivita atlantica TaxID=1317121 RepID=A0A0L1JPB3_9RHOB|nr:DUF1800 domain-containing protein [Pseudaestuariivita atlantica]KNG93610.1 hypothetical protein ATO11_10400 [Pseudaestuariivita atlantica]
MAFQPVTAAIRFGCGLSPVVAPPADLASLFEQIVGPDEMAAAYPLMEFDAFQAEILEYRDLVRARRKARGTDGFQARRKAANVFRKNIRQRQMRWLQTHMLRRVDTRQGLRERLVAFWADHFTAQGKGGIARWGTTPYVETSIRPHVAGSFADMLVDVVTAPLMLMYLDQDRSIGPNSQMGIVRRNKGRPSGLNENLAREVLELHTLGVNGPYTQDDVRQLAELFTGMSFQPEVGFNFRKPLAEPGTETVMGKTYGGSDEHFSHVEEALRDIAAHPATAAHIARKLVVHFVSDTPDPAHVAHVEARFNETGGNLAEVTAALIEHPAAWETERPNVKQPFEFVSSSLRALAVPAAAFEPLNERQSQALLATPLAQMGQVWERPAGPDGFPEQDDAWITPQGLAARLNWAVTVPRILMGDLPDPRAFVDTALGPRATDAVRFAARASESVHEGVALILSSPAFQRL